MSGTPDHSSLEGVTDLPRAEGDDSYDDVGRLEYVCVDLAPLRVWFQESLEFYLDETNAQLFVTHEIEAPPDVVWNTMMDLAARPEWTKRGSTIKEFGHVQGARGHPGEIYQCLHDDGTTAVHFTVCFDQIRRASGWTHAGWTLLHDWLGRPTGITPVGAVLRAGD